MDGGDGNEDPVKRPYDFFSLWVETDYSRELAEYAELAEEVSIAFDSGEPHHQVCDLALREIDNCRLPVKLFPSDFGSLGTLNSGRTVLRCYPHCQF